MIGLKVIFPAPAKDVHQFFELCILPPPYDTPLLQFLLVYRFFPATWSRPLLQFNVSKCQVINFAPIKNYAECIYAIIGPMFIFLVSKFVILITALNVHKRVIDCILGKSVVRFLDFTAFFFCREPYVMINHLLH